jgi:hypothetical protein
LCLPHDLIAVAGLFPGQEAEHELAGLIVFNVALDEAHGGAGGLDAVLDEKRVERSAATHAAGAMKEHHVAGAEAVNERV